MAIIIAIVMIVIFLCSCSTARYTKEDVVIVNGATGFKMDKYIVTCYHVVKGLPFAQVEFYNKKIAYASIVAVDTLNDIALVFIPNSYRPYETSEPDIRKKVYAIGHPYQLYWSEMSGEVQSVSRELNGKTLIQVSLDSYFGFSGSPIFNESGALIGMGSMFIPETRFTLIVPIQNIVLLIKKANHANYNARALPQKALEKD